MMFTDVSAASKYPSQNSQDSHHLRLDCKLLPLHNQYGLSLHTQEIQARKLHTDYMVNGQLYSLKHALLICDS